MKLDLTDIRISNPSTEATVHPLLEFSKKSEDPNAPETVIHDPLQTCSNSDPVVGFADPLGVMDAVLSDDLDVTKLKISPKDNNKPETVGLELETGNLDNTLVQKNEDAIPDLDPVISDFTPWKEMKKRILKEFTASDQLSLESSFLSKDSLKSVIREEKLKGKKSHDKSPVKLVGLSQAEFEQKMVDFRKLLIFLWQKERRIDCIKLTVEICRLLSSVSVPQYYPSLFVHVTDFLDLFGNLVYERLHQKAKEERKSCHLPPLSTHFTTSEILENTRITARNWFGKVQEIKEVLPRIYFEVTLLPCMRFMDDSATMANMMRMGALARSLQHPLVSNYARCYICRMAMRLDSTDRAPSWLCLNDWMQTYTNQPIFLLWPALEYIIQCVSYGAVTYNDLLPLWEYCGTQNKRNVILCSFLNGVSKFYLSEHSLEATKLVTDADEVTSEELCALGKNLCLVDVDEKHKKQILRIAWKSINRIVPVKGFLTAVDVWIEFVVRHFTTNELGIILDHVLRIVTQNKVYELHYSLLTSIIEKIMNHSTDIPAVLQLDTFVRLTDLLRKDSVKKEISLIILTAFVKKTKRGSFSDLKLAHQVIEICKKAHDSVTVFSTEEEVKTVSLLIQNTLDRFQGEMEPERLLEFLVSCRSAMMNVDEIQKYIVVRLLSLTLNVTRRSRFSTARAVFLHSCVANLFITIPSIRNPEERIKLNIQSGQISLISETFAFLESFLEATVYDFETLTNPTDFEKLSPFFLSLLISAPDSVHEKTGPMIIFGNFLEVVKRFSWPKTNTAERQKSKILLNCLQALLFRRRLYDRTIVANSWSSDQFKWIDRSPEAKEKYSPEIDQNISQLVDQLLPGLKIESNMNPELSLELVEIVSRFGTEEIVESLAMLAKECYKKCKKIPKMQERIKAAKQEAKD